MRSCSPAIVATMSRIGPGPRAAELREERVGKTSGGGERRAVGVLEVLLDQVDEMAALEDEPAPAPQPECVVERRSVERDRDRGPPVDDDGITVVVLHVTPADVPGRSVILVDPPEAEWPGLRGDRLQPATQMDVCDRCVPVARRALRCVCDRGARTDRHGVETLVRVVEVRLLGQALGIQVDGTGARLAKPRRPSPIFATVIRSPVLFH